MYSLLIKQGRLIDGTGKPERVADIAVEGDKIVAVDSNISTGARTVIDAQGKIVTPGFVDLQNHSDSYWQLFDNPSLDSLITQGYTTAIVGNCGASLAPLLSPQALLALQKWHNLEGVNLNWQSFGEFREVMVARRFGCNIGTLVGYSTLRRGLVGDQTAPLSSQELGALKAALQRALDEGALGLSTGLSYAHEIETSELELYELAQVVKSKEALLSIHLRNEAGEIIDSVREAVNLAQQAGAKVKISHLKIRNSVNWPKLEELLTELETAWHKGAQLHYDVYPYTSIWQVLYSYLPKWSIAGGRHHMLEQLRNPTQRNKILTHLNNSESPLKELVIASTASNLNINGKTISKLAKDMEISSEQAILRLIENGGSEVLAFDNCLSEDGVEELSNHALGYIASDGAGFPLSVKDKLVHPRCFGAAPKFLSQVIASKKISLPEAVRKLTAGPAETVGLKNRGVIKTGNFADIVIFDEQRIRDCATLTNPYQFAEGIIHVLVNGQSAVHSGQLIGTDNGKFLTRN